MTDFTGIIIVVSIWGVSNIITTTFDCNPARFSNSGSLTASIGGVNDQDDEASKFYPRLRITQSLPAFLAGCLLMSYGWWRIRIRSSYSRMDYWIAGSLLLFGAGLINVGAVTWVL